MNKLLALMLDRLMAWLIGPSGWGAAQALVALYEDQEMPSTEKRARVLEALLVELKLMGLDLASSLVNFAIEAAVQYLRRGRK